jgi:hypothetical protein
MRVFHIVHRVARDIVGNRFNFKTDGAEDLGDLVLKECNLVPSRLVALQSVLRRHVATYSCPRELESLNASLYSNELL